MNDYITFEASIEPMVWGKSTYTVLHLPDDIVAALGKTRRVEGEFNDHPVNLAMARAPVAAGVFLWAGKSLLERVGLTPGERFEVRLRPAPADRVDVPADVANALRRHGLTEAWDALTPGAKRRHLHHIETARRDHTRAKRIAALQQQLAHK